MYQVPIFNKKEEIFTNLSEYNVPLLRAAWFLKVIANMKISTFTPVYLIPFRSEKLPIHMFWVPVSDGMFPVYTWIICYGCHYRYLVLILCYGYKQELP